MKHRTASGELRRPDSYSVRENEQSKSLRFCHRADRLVERRFGKTLHDLSVVHIRQRVSSVSDELCQYL